MLTPCTIKELLKRTPKGPTGWRSAYNKRYRPEGREMMLAAVNLERSNAGRSPIPDALFNFAGNLLSENVRAAKIAFWNEVLREIENE